MNSRENSFNKNAQNIPPHGIIFKEGDPGADMFVITEGEVEIRKKTGQKSYKVLVTLKKGDFFGEMAIVENKPRSATAVAKVQTRLIRLDTNAFYNMVEHSSDFAVKMIKTLSSRLRNADHLIEYLLGSNDEKQVIMGLASYVKSHPETDTGSGEFKIVLKPFLHWASQNLGLPDQLVQDAIKRLVVRKVLNVYDPPGRISAIYLGQNLMSRL